MSGTYDQITQASLLIADMGHTLANASNISSSSSSIIISSSSISSSSTVVPENPEQHSKLTMGILGTLYSLIFIIGIVGNSLVVYVVCVKKSMQSVTNLFIMNLGLSDILMCLLAVPFTPIAFFQEHWVLGKFLCHLVSYSLGISVYVSTLTSLAIAIDRYFVIVHPFKPRMKLGVCILLITVVWIVSLSISLPLAIYMKLIESTVDGEIKYSCREAWPIPMSKRFFNLASYVLQYLIPFIVISYSYIKVWIVLSKRTRPGKTKEKEEMELRRKKRTNRMLIAMVCIFAGCWMPLNCVHLIMEFNESFVTYKYFHNAFFTAHVIAMSSTIYNPFLYAWLNDNFRKEFRLIIPWIFTLIKWVGNLWSCKRLRRRADQEDVKLDDIDATQATNEVTMFANCTSVNHLPLVVDAENEHEHRAAGAAHKQSAKAANKTKNKKKNYNSLNLKHLNYAQTKLLEKESDNKHETNAKNSNTTATAISNTTSTNANATLTNSETKRTDAKQNSATTEKQANSSSGNKERLNAVAEASEISGSTVAPLETTS